MKGYPKRVCCTTSRQCAVALVAVLYPAWLGVPCGGACKLHVSGDGSGNGVVVVRVSGKKALRAYLLHNSAQ